jgi:hypothetical protein
MLRGCLHRRLRATLKALQRESALLRLTDVPVEAVCELPQAQSISGGQRVERELELLALGNGAVGERASATALVVYDANAAVRRHVDPINQAAEAEPVISLTDHQGWVPRKAELRLETGWNVLSLVLPQGLERGGGRLNDL